MKRERFLFIINPIAGGLDKSAYVEQLNTIFQKKQKDFSIYETTGNNDKEKALNAIDKYQPDVVVAVGGDGTCNMVASLIFDKEIILGIVPLGSANGLATELNISDDLDEATELLFDGIVKPIDALVINENKICLHLSDLGLNAKVVKRFEEEKKRGMMGYARQFAREIFNSNPSKYMFELKGNRFKRKAHMVVIANASKYGTGAIVNPSGRIDDGVFEVCIIKPFPLYALLGLTLHLFRGTLLTSAYVDVIKAQQIRIFNLPREVLQIDGEIEGHPEEVRINVKKHAFTIIVPESDL